MGFFSKIFGGIKKIIKGVGKIIKKGVRKVGGFFKRVFKGVGKFIGKLGPIGMLGMMLIMPQLGAWWSQFGAWAGQLSGPMAGFMKGIHAAGNFIGKAYSSVTEGIDKVLGGFAESVGLGDAYTRTTGFIGEKMGDLQTKLGLHTEASAAAFKSSLDPIQEITVSAVKRPVTPSVPSVETPKLFDPAAARIEAGVDAETLAEKLSGPGTYTGTADSATVIGQQDLLQEIEVTATKRPGGTPKQSKFSKAFDKIKDIHQGVTTIKELAADLGLTEEEYIRQFGGSVADLALDLETSLAGSNADWTQQGFAGQAAYGPYSQQWQQSILQIMQQQDPTYLQWMRSATGRAV